MIRRLVVLFLLAVLVADAYRMWGRDGAVLVAILLGLLLALPRLLGGGARRAAGPDPRGRRAVGGAAVKYSRWMTPDAKAEILAQWERWKAEPLPTDRGYLGGLGFPDPEIFGWCDRLNALPGVCTLQSCAGHRHPEGYVWNGQLWLWLDRRISMAFDARAFELVECPFIERVNRIYHDDGQEIADVIFRGAATGDLERSLLHIDMFFHDLEDLALQVEGPR